MAIFEVKTQELINKANEFESLVRQDQELIRKMRTLIMSLDSEWKGEAEQALVNNFQSKQMDISNFHDMLGECIDLMRQASSKAAEMDNKLLQMVRRI